MLFWEHDISFSFLSSSFSLSFFFLSFYFPFYYNLSPFLFHFGLDPDQKIVVKKGIRRLKRTIIQAILSS